LKVGKTRREKYLTSSSWHSEWEHKINFKIRFKVKRANWEPYNAIIELKTNFKCQSHSFFYPQIQAD
jgi:hypothetical protein